MTDLLRSDLNDFLFTRVADDPNGMHLTMLSALARSGVDPPEDDTTALAACLGATPFAQESADPFTRGSGRRK